MPSPRILIAGIGNVFLGDDAFGVEVVGRLLRRTLPSGVRAVDFGIRGYDLAFALLDGYETAILVDATQRGGPPGTLYVIEPDADDHCVATLDAHRLDPVQAIRFARSLGEPLPRLLVVGCEPAPLSPNDFPTGLSAPVRTAVDEAVALVESLVARRLEGNHSTPTPIDSVTPTP